MRIYLSGEITIEGESDIVRAGDFPGSQARAAFAVLVGRRGRAIPRSELADSLWPQRRPKAWDSAISALVSKVRGLPARVGLSPSTTVVGSDGCYTLRLPADSWIDHEVAADAIHDAEAALRVGDPARAYGPSAVAHHIARRPFLPNQGGHWFEQRRDHLSNLLIRALEVRAEVYLWNGEAPLAVEAAREVVRLRGFRETGYRLLMRAHADEGNRAEALRVYERCRELISSELGVSPSQGTQALYRELLGAT